MIIKGSIGFSLVFQVYLPVRKKSKEKSRNSELESNNHLFAPRNFHNAGEQVVFSTTCYQKMSNKNRSFWWGVHNEIFWLNHVNENIWVSTSPFEISVFLSQIPILVFSARTKKNVLGLCLNYTVKISRS